MYTRRVRWSPQVLVVFIWNHLAEEKMYLHPLAISQKILGEKGRDIVREKILEEVGGIVRE